MANFEQLCKVIIDTNGNPSTEDVLRCGYTMENFLRISQNNVKADRLVKNAKRALKDRGIYYKEM